MNYMVFYVAELDWEIPGNRHSKGQVNTINDQLEIHPIAVTRLNQVIDTINQALNRMPTKGAPETIYVPDLLDLESGPRLVNGKVEIGGDENAALRSPATIIAKVNGLLGHKLTKFVDLAKELDVSKTRVQNIYEKAIRELVKDAELEKLLREYTFKQPYTFSDGLVVRPGKRFKISEEA